MHCHISKIEYIVSNIIAIGLECITCTIKLCYTVKYIIVYSSNGLLGGVFGGIVRVRRAK